MHVGIDQPRHEDAATAVHTMIAVRRRNPRHVDDARTIDDHADIVEQIRARSIEHQAILEGESHLIAQWCEPSQFHAPGRKLALLTGVAFVLQLSLLDRAYLFAIRALGKRLHPKHEPTAK